MATKFRNIEEPVIVEETELLKSTKQQQKEAEEQAAKNDGVQSSHKEEGKEKKKVSWGRQILGGEILTTRKALKLLPLILLIVLCGALLVANRYRVESLRKDIIHTQKQIDQLSLKQIELKSQYQQSIKISNISNTLDSIGVHLITEPPYTLKEK